MRRLNLMRKTTLILIADENGMKVMPGRCPYRHVVRYRYMYIFWGCASYSCWLVVQAAQRSLNASLTAFRLSGMVFCVCCLGSLKSRLDGESHPCAKGLGLK